MIQLNDCKDHSNETIEGLCLDRQCNEKSDYCSLCLQLHKKHKDQCKNFEDLDSLFQMIKNETMEFKTNFEQKKTDLGEQFNQLHIQGYNLQIDQLQLFILLITKRQYVELSSHASEIKRYQSWYFSDKQTNDKLFDQQCYNKGSQLIEANQFEDALEEIEKALAMNQDDCDLLSLKAKALRKLKRYQEALKVTSEGLQNNGGKSSNLFIEQSIRLIYKGYVLLEMKQYEMALIYVDLVIKTEPSQAAHVCKGLILVQMNEIEQATLSLQEAVKFMSEKNSNGKIEELKQLAQALRDHFIELDTKLKEQLEQKSKIKSLHAQGRYTEAIKEFDKILQQQSNDAETYYKKGASLHALGKYQEAINCYDMALKFRPNESVIYSNKGCSLSLLNKIEEAIECFQIAISLDPKNDYAYFSLGLSLHKQGQYEEALENFDKAIEIQPNEPNFYKGRSDTIAVLDRIQKAKKSKLFKDDIKQKIFCIQKEIDIGHQLYKSDQLEEAIKHFDIALQLEPDNMQALLFKGSSLRLLEQFEEAIEQYDQIIKTGQQNASVLKEKGQCHQGLGQNMEALNCFDQSIQMDSENAYPYFYKGMISFYEGLILSKLTLYQEAIQLFKIAIQKNPNIDIFYNQIVLALFKISEYEQALKYLDQLLKLNPENHSALCFVGLALNELEQYDKAIQYFDAAILFSPNNAQYYSKKGEVLIKLNRNEEALECLTQALELDPNVEIDI